MTFGKENKIWFLSIISVRLCVSLTLLTAVLQWSYNGPEDTNALEFVDVKWSRHIYSVWYYCDSGLMTFRSYFLCLLIKTVCLTVSLHWSVQRLGWLVFSSFVSTDLPCLLLLSPSSSSSSQSDPFRKSKLPRAVSTVRLTTLGDRLCLPPCTHKQSHSQAVRSHFSFLFFQEFFES